MPEMCYMRRMQLSLDEGPLIVTFPWPMSDASAEYVEDALALFLRQVKRPRSKPEPDAAVSHA